MESFQWGVIGPWSGWGAFLALAFLNVRAIWVGLVIPRPSHKEAIERANHDANEWRAEGRIKDQAILVELGHIREQTEEIGSTLHNFVAGLQKATGVDPEKGDDES